jgi:hypothetical protein
VVESVCVLTDRHDLLIYDLAAMAPFGFTAGGQILRTTQGRLRKFHAGAPGLNLAASAPLQLVSAGATTAPTALALHGYDRLPDGVRLRWQAQFPAGAVAITETLRIVRDGPQGRLVRELKADGIPVGARLEFPGLAATLTPDTPTATADLPLPPAQAAPPWKGKPLADPGQPEGALERPGYRAVALPRPKTVSGEDRIMPAAVAVHPRDGRVFVASLKTGELFALHDAADPRQAKWQNYGRGLFQDALSLLADDDALYVLHRRNLTRTPDGIHFERVASLPHGVADTYDYGYGLARDRGGAFVLSFAPYANTQLPGSGGGVRLVPGKPPEEVAYGMRNPLGWCAGPEGEIFFTDNQGEWVATNKLCHLEPGKFYGFPNAAQKQHANKPPGRAAVWVPYGWARSINGVAYDHTGGQFGPFAGQFFLAELMFGGALIRAQVEKVNGVYQGACFPFWGQGLMGPVSLAFSPRGQLYVGGITEPGWMAQPDRGALYRIDYTGPPPFEILAIHVRPNGFRLAFTGPVDPATARDPMAYQLEHYRYEYTGAYGSPELDRTRVPVERAAVAADGRGVELTIPALVKDRVYLIGAPGVRSAAGAALVHPTGAYTLNEVPGP